MGIDNPTFDQSKIALPRGETEETVEAAEAAAAEETLDKSGDVSTLMPKLVKRFQGLDPSINLAQMEGNFLGKMRAELIRINGSIVTKNITLEQATYSNLVLGENTVTFNCAIVVFKKTEVRRCQLQFVKLKQNGVDVLACSWAMNPVAAKRKI